jgi:formylglycine-generating enzyme required for sulfatase activity
MSGQIFISYRREDSAAWSGRLADRLKIRFPSNQIFMDIDAIDPGVDFVEAVEEVVGACDVLIAVIGSRWLTSSDRRGKRRLDIPEDLVRLEIATALKRGIRVVPVLVEGATMPEAGELPDDLKALVRRNALEIDHSRFNTDSERLITAIERALGKAAEQREREENERLAAQQQERLDREQRERAATEIRERQGKEQLDARRQQERLEAEKVQREEQERTGHQPNVQHPSPSVPVVQSKRPVKAEPEKSPDETPKFFYPLAKSVEPERKERSPSPSVGIGRKSPSKQVIAFLAVAAVFVVGALAYLVVRASHPPAPVALAIPSPPIAPVALDNATKHHPWVNSLGMKFVPVPGTQVLFSIWDTRVQDFEAFVNSTGYVATGGMYSVSKDGWRQGGSTWKEPGFSQGPTHPVVGVSWNDAKEFCQWLTKRERSAGNLPQDREYRLPKDDEWSAAVGLKNEVGSTPQEKDGKIKLYPWDIPQKRDKSWPPPPGAGNYAGEEVKNGGWPSGSTVIEGYNDGYPRTSPVGSFAVNQFGLYDMGGNVSQWCEDWYNAQMQYRVLRGESWDYGYPNYLLASCRLLDVPGYRSDYVGFRCVVAVESSR